MPAARASGNVDHIGLETVKIAPPGSSAGFRQGYGKKSNRWSDGGL
jgi:hypothetical protein